jgi:hypothetical protein
VIEANDSSEDPGSIQTIRNKHTHTYKYEMEVNKEKRKLQEL